MKRRTTLAQLFQVAAMNILTIHLAQFLRDFAIWGVGFLLYVQLQISHGDPPLHRVVDGRDRSSPNSVRGLKGEGGAEKETEEGKNEAKKSVRGIQAVQVSERNRSKGQGACMSRWARNGTGELWWRSSCFCWLIESRIETTKGTKRGRGLLLLLFFSVDDFFVLLLGYCFGCTIDSRDS